MNDYDKFIAGKIRSLEKVGFSADVSTKLFDFQQWIVKNALEAGRYAIFADCGLGKSAMQIEWAWQVHKYTGKPVLILCPLAVAPVGAHDAVATRPPGRILVSESNEHRQFPPASPHEAASM